MTHNTSREVILHVSDEAGDLQRALDAAAALREVDLHAHVRIIVNGPALSGLTGDNDLQAPEETEIAACSIGMRRHDIDPKQLRPSVQTVPSAVVTIVEAQLAGAAYVRI